MRTSLIRFTLPLFLAAVGKVAAYPEFQQHINRTSGRSVNCALCHTHSDGPEGTAPGQIGKLSQAELSELGRARAAFTPGAKPNSPILNAFGNHIIDSIGKTKLLEVRLHPADLPGLLPQDSDLDHDGIPNTVELATGTHPLLKTDGLPWLLFTVNLTANWGQIVLMLGATVFGLMGLKHLLTGFAIATHEEE